MKHVIVGAGIAGISAAEELRRGDASCEITVIGEEPYYFRAALSKYLQKAIDAEEVYGKADDWYRANDIIFKMNAAEAVDAKGKVVICEDGTVVPYDRLLLATGAVPVILDWPGKELEGVCTYRGVSCVERFARHVNEGAQRAVVIGGGILGIELAEDFVKLGLETTLIVRGATILDLLFDDFSAGVVKKQIVDAGVHLLFDTEVAQFEGDSGRVTRLVTKKNETIPCDIVGIAIGIRPNIALLKGSTIYADKAILVDSYLRTNEADVYAAGDCCAVKAGEAASPIPTRTWLTSALQGRTAALNMLEKNVPFEEGIFFNVSHVFNSFYAVIGVFNPRDPKGYEFKDWRFSDGGYMRWTLAGGTVVGAIIIDAQKYIWPVRQLIESAVDVSSAVRGDIARIDLHELVPQDNQVLF